MASTDIIHKGEDRELQFTLLESDGTTPVNLTTELLDLVVWLYAKAGTDTVLKKYSRDALTDHDNNNLVITDAAAGEFTIRLQAETTRLAREGMLLAEIKARFTNTDYSNNTFDTIVRGLEVGQIKNSLTGNLDSM